MPTRPAPAKAFPKPPVPSAPKPTAPKPSAPKPSAPKPTAPATTPRARPPKPAGNPGPGRHWVFNAKTNSWEAKRNQVAVPSRPTSSTVSAPGAAPGGTSGGTGNTGGGGNDSGGGEAPVSSKTPEQIAADIRASAESAVSTYDPALEGRWTSETKGLGGLGFGYTKAGGKAATYADIFGSLAPGGSVNRSAFEVRDALGRVINKDILNTDVYGGAAATDIAGTALGNEILAARRSSAQAAENRAASGITGGGLRNAAGEVEDQQKGAAITGLLGKLYGLEGEITGERTKRYQGALEDAAEGNVGRWAPEPTPTPSTPSTTPSPAKVDLTPGPKGTFMKQVNEAKASGTPAQKVKKLTALLNNPKYNLSALQKKTIRQLIANLNKK